MKVAIFLIGLFYLLPGGYNYVYTGVHQNSYSQKRPINNPGYPVVKETNPAQGDAFYIASVIEDEDINNLSARKNKWPARSFYTDPHTAVSTHLYSCFKAPRPIHGFLSGKYITQRTLRI